jgi:hypothetical protein
MKMSRKSMRHSSFDATARSSSSRTGEMGPRRPTSKQKK